MIAAVDSAAGGEGLDDAGASEVVVGLDGIWRAGSNLQSIGWTSGEPAIFPPYATIGQPKSLSSFLIDGAVADELATLVRLVGTGQLPVTVGQRGPVERYAVQRTLT